MRQKITLVMINILSVRIFVYLELRVVLKTLHLIKRGA